MPVAAKLRTVPTALESRHLHQIEAVVHGKSSSTELEPVSTSWKRCSSELLVDPGAPSAPNILTECELRISREPFGKAIQQAQEEIDRLYAIVRQEGYVVLLCNTDGVAIHHRGDEGQAERFRYWGIWIGGIWSERIEGTNGIGTCIAEQRPVLVHRDQHFRTRHIGLTCAGAPIFDPGGRLMMVLDTSSMSAGQSHTLALAATKVAARGVEERLFRDHFRNIWTVAVASFDNASETLLLAVDADQRIVGADRLARLAFGLDDDGLSRGAHLSSLFEFDRSVFRLGGAQDIAARFLRAGADEYWCALITPPIRGSGSWRSLAEAAIHSRPRIGLLQEMPV